MDGLGEFIRNNGEFWHQLRQAGETRVLFIVHGQHVDMHKVHEALSSVVEAHIDVVLGFAPSGE